MAKAKTSKARRPNPPRSAKKTLKPLSSKLRQGSPFKADVKEATSVPPLKLTLIIKSLRKLMDRHDAMAAKLSPITEAIEKTRERILNEFTGDEISTTTAHGLRVTKNRKQSPRIENLNKFMKYATKDRRHWDLLQKSVSSTAWRARLKDGVVVPGVAVFNSVSVSVTRV